MKKTEPFNLGEYLIKRDGERDPSLKRDNVLIRIAKARDCGICQVCGVFTPNMEAHHVHGLAEGGLDTLNNLLMLCRKCHKAAPVDPSQFLDFQRSGGPIWGDIRKTLFESLVTDPEMACLTPKDIDRLALMCRIQMFGKTSAFEADESKERQELIAHHHAIVSKHRKRYYHESLPHLAHFHAHWESVLGKMRAIL